MWDNSVCLLTQHFISPFYVSVPFLVVTQGGNWSIHVQWLPVQWNLVTVLHWDLCGFIFSFCIAVNVCEVMQKKAVTPEIGPGATCPIQLGGDCSWAWVLPAVTRAPRTRRELLTFQLRAEISVTLLHQLDDLIKLMRHVFTTFPQTRQ